MTDLTYRLDDFGRRLERGTNLVNLLRAAVSADVKTPALLEPLLEIADSSMTHRRRYLAQAQLSSITGEFSSDDLLGVIFSRFRIGK